MREERTFKKDIVKNLIETARAERLAVGTIEWHQEFYVHVTLRRVVEENETRWEIKAATKVGAFTGENPTLTEGVAYYTPFRKKPIAEAYFEKLVEKYGLEELDVRSVTPSVEREAFEEGLRELFKKGIQEEENCE